VRKLSDVCGWLRGLTAQKDVERLEEYARELVEDAQRLEAAER